MRTWLSSMSFAVRALRGALLSATVVLLAGCAGTYRLDNDVRTFSSLPAIPAQPTYRFERLPSQQNDQQPQIEAFADGALFRAGLKRDDAAARYSVQLGARVQRTLSPWADPWDGMGGGGLLGPVGPYWGAPFPRMEQPWYRREVSVILREIAGNRVVYETHALSEGPWYDNQAAFPAMFDAALQGFPAAPAGGLRKVAVDIPTAR